MKFTLSITILSALLASAVVTDAASVGRDLKKGGKRKACKRDCRLAQSECELDTAACDAAFQTCKDDCIALLACKKECKGEFKECKLDCAEDPFQGEANQEDCIDNVCAEEMGDCREACVVEVP